MINSKTRVAGRVISILMIFALLFAANCCALSAAADTLGTTLYVKTTKTSTPYIYYWIDDGVEAGWPGKPMTSEGSDVYSYELPVDIGELTGIIVNGSSAGDKLTDDVKNITGNFYDVDAGKWDMYDAGSIKIKSVGADVASPAYVGSKVTFFVNAEGEGDLQYKISANGDILSDFSGKNTVLWEPKAAGDYKILFEVKDSSGETNSREMSYTVESPEGAEKPIFLSASPANGAKIAKDAPVTVDVNGAGGQVNNKILFYKTEVVDPNGNVVNTAYYTTGSKIAFTPSLVGEYTVNMYIQNNTVKNETTMATYTYNSTTEAIDTETESDVIVSDTDSQTDVISETDTQTESDIVTDSDTETVSDIPDTDTQTDVISETDTQTESDVPDTDTQTDVPNETDVKTDTDTQTDTETDNQTDTDTDLDVDFGDVDGNGTIELKDAYIIQSDVLSKKSYTEKEIEMFDINHDGKVSLKDASLIQQHTLGLYVIK